uniref:Uncharacterized protein n=1 Tax=Talaromyces marneffei PM1 TaxID=1077442 RepID=A0A093UMM0_TALMA
MISWIGHFTLSAQDTLPEETVAFLQNWLYFGTLWVVLGNNCAKRNYVTPGSYEYGIITTELLNGHVDQHILDLKSLAYSDQYSLQSIL